MAQRPRERTPAARPTMAPPPTAGTANSAWEPPPAAAEAPPPTRPAVEDQAERLELHSAGATLREFARVFHACADLEHAVEIALTAGDYAQRKQKAIAEAEKELADLTQKIRERKTELERLK